jgi:tetratricopeptide (TPR) repeat protein
MAGKNKSTTRKDNESRMSKPQVNKTPKDPETRPRAVASRSGAVAVEQPADSERQFQSFAAAMKLFHARQFKEARELFHRAAQGPERDVANRAQLHGVMCDRRLQQTPVDLHTADDYYTYGIAMMNTRNLAEACANLEKGLAIEPAADHIHYALALARALSGDVTGAYEHLKRAIELEPRNRIAARQDTDFAPLANQPPFDALLYPEKKNW